MAMHKRSTHWHGVGIYQTSEQLAMAVIHQQPVLVDNMRDLLSNDCQADRKLSYISPHQSVERLCIAMFSIVHQQNPC